MYKAIVFDLGKVLIPFDFRIGYRAIEGACPYRAAEIPRRISETGLVERFEKGLIEPRDFFVQLSEALRLVMEYDTFCRAWSSIFCGQLIPDQTLKALAGRYRLLLLSNTNAIHWQMVQDRYTLWRHFHDHVLSFEIHALKPDPAMFRAAIERAGCSAGECFYTDDIAVNVDAARQEGMDAVVFESPAQLQAEMQRRGIDSGNGLSAGRRDA